MALFKKKEIKQGIPTLPELPKLPELPEFPETENFSDEELPQFPSFPNDSLGNRFSQNTIKEAVTGRKEVEGVEADEFAGEELPEEGERMRGMRRPLVREETDTGFFPKIEQDNMRDTMTEAEPIFVRIDKFEEGSKEFDEVRKKVTEIENMFENVKKIKEKEKRELELWEDEIRNIKEKIEKIDRNIFSRLG